MNLLTRAALRLERMNVRGGACVGWSARFTGDPNWCWAARREIAVAGCAQRRAEVLAGVLVRGSTGYYSA